MKKTLIILSGILFLGFQTKSQNKQLLIDNNNRFAFDIYKELKSAHSNLIFSPFSISSAMAMTYAGAKNNTLKEFSKALYFFEDQEMFHQEFGNLLKDIDSDKKSSIEFYNANSLWIQKNFKLNDKFLMINKKYYSSALFSADFNNPDQSSKEINGWVEKNTRKKINNLIQPSALGPDTKLVLVNAIYFKGGWDMPFKKEKNTEDKFTISKNEEVTTTFMNREIKTWYYKDCLKEIIEIPYAGNDYAMIIILPKNYRKLKWVEHFLSVKCMERYIKKREKLNVKVSIPKFKLDGEFDLKEALNELGLKDAFTGSADFSAMAEEKLFIDKVVHKATIDVNEEGTEAAAATAVIMRKTAVLMESVSFKADRPFIYAIKNTKNGSIYFLGRVMNPEK